MQTDAAAEKTVPEREQAVALFRAMLLVRRFEEKAAELYQAGKIRGFLHLYVGEEAVAVGAMQSLQEDDAVVATYREHGHALVRGITAGSLMSEMYGKANGCSRGRGGSMHIFDVSRRFFGGYAIVGGGLPIATGLALADRMQRLNRVTACFFGEGAVAEGEFHESLNLASLWRLPVLFICENNLYAMGTALEISQAEPDIAAKARVHRMPAEAVDGMDVLAVEAAVKRACDAIRRGEGPQFVECQTYRFRGHSMADPELYRSKDEVEEWRKRDPIALYREQLIEWEMLSDAGAEEIESSVTAEIDGAIAEAEGGSWEPSEDLMKDVTG